LDFLKARLLLSLSNTFFLVYFQTLSFILFMRY